MTLRRQDRLLPLALDSLGAQRRALSRELSADGSLLPFILILLFSFRRLRRWFLLWLRLWQYTHELHRHRTAATRAAAY
jgi:hypothetical protein